MSIGASLNYTPSSVIQQSTTTEVTTSRKAVTDAFVLWNFTTEQSLRVSASNLTPLAYYTGSVSDTSTITANPNPQLITSNSGGPSYTLWQVRWEMKI